MSTNTDQWQLAEPGQRLFAEVTERCVDGEAIRPFELGEAMSCLFGSAE